MNEILVNYQTTLPYDYLTSPPLMEDVSRYQSLIDQETGEVIEYMDRDHVNYKELLKSELSKRYDIRFN